MSKLTWVITTLDGTHLGTIDTRSDAKVTVGLNAPSIAQVTLSAEDPLAAEVRPLERMLLVLLDDTPIFKGPITDPEYSDASGSGSAQTVTINAQDMSIRLQRSVTLRMPVQKNKLLDYVMRQLFANASKSLPTNAKSIGIKIGNKYPSIPGAAWEIPRDDFKFGDGTVIYDAIQAIALRSDGPDIELRPLDEQGSQYHAQLDLYVPAKARTLSDPTLPGFVGFEYNLGRHTARDFKYSPAGSQMVNHYLVVGPKQTRRKPHTKKKKTANFMAIGEVADSIARYGRYTTLEANSKHNISWARSEARAKLKYRAYAADYFEFTPVLEEGSYEGQESPDGQGYFRPPKFGPYSPTKLPGDPTQPFDYYLGDTISVAAKATPGLSAITRAVIQPAGVLGHDDPLAKAQPLILTGKVVAAEISEDDNAGNVQTKLTLTATPRAAGVTVTESRLTGWTTARRKRRHH